MRSLLDVLENDFLGHGGQWIGGDKAGIADINAMWIVKWAMQTLNMQSEPGFGKDSYPRIHRWIESIKPHVPESEEGTKIDGDEATKTILGAEYAIPDIGVDPKDPLQLKEGDKVAIEATDAVPGTCPQLGKIVGLDTKKSVIQLENGIRVHFPRVGYFIYKQ